MIDFEGSLIRVFLGIIGFVSLIYIVSSFIRFLIIKIYNYAKSKSQQRESPKSQKR